MKIAGRTKPEIIKLFEAGKIGKLQLKNRIISAPIGTRYATKEGFVSDRLLAYYAARAKGGASLVVVEVCNPISLGESPYMLNITKDEHVAGLRELVKVIHAGGAATALQINPHRGVKDPTNPLSPSDTSDTFSGKRAHALSVAEIKKLEDEFGEGVRRAKEAGFDSINIHGGHGYLIAGFLSPRTNKRTDQYGGDIIRRARLALEMVETARGKTGPDYPITFRLIGDEKIEGGLGLKDAIVVSKLLQEAGIDAIDVDAGTFGTDEWITPSYYMPPACYVYLSEAVKKELKIPVLVAGNIHDPFIAERILREGKADFIHLGRPIVADPEFPRKAMEGRKEDIRKCIACLICREAVGREVPLACSVNPAAGRERDFEIEPAKKGRRVLVVGGGPAGMESAIIAAQRGHDVTLWEKSDELGGQLIIAAVPPYKEGLSDLVEYLKKQLWKSKVKIDVNKEANADAILEFSPDVVIVAAGAKPVIPDIKGVGCRKTPTCNDVLSSKTELGKRVIVVGGGRVGCETAHFLASRGKDVTITSRQIELAADIYIRVRKSLIRCLEEEGVRIVTGVQKQEITERGTEFINREGEKVALEADDIVISGGYASDKALYQSLKGKVAELYEVGDCVDARSILEAIQEGAEAALKI